jgi:hypothetical protein
VHRRASIPEIACAAANVRVHWELHDSIAGLIGEVQVRKVNFHTACSSHIVRDNMFVRTFCPKLLGLLLVWATAADGLQQRLRYGRGEFQPRQAFESYKHVSEKVHEPLFESVRVHTNLHSSNLDQINSRLYEGGGLQTTLDSTARNATRKQIEQVKQFVASSVMAKFVEPEAKDGEDQAPSTIIQQRKRSVTNAITLVKGYIADMHQVGQRVVSLLKKDRATTPGYDDKIRDEMKKMNSSHGEFDSTVTVLTKMFNENPMYGENREAVLKLRGLLEGINSVFSKVQNALDTDQQMLLLASEIAKGANGKGGSFDKNNFFSVQSFIQVSALSTYSPTELTKMKIEYDRLKFGATSNAKKAELIENFLQGSNGLINVASMIAKQEIQKMKSGRFDSKGNMARKTYEALGAAELMADFTKDFKDPDSLAHQLILAQQQYADRAFALNESTTAQESADILARIRSAVNKAREHVKQLVVKIKEGYLRDHGGIKGIDAGNNNEMQRPQASPVETEKDKVTENAQVQAELIRAEKSNELATVSKNKALKSAELDEQQVLQQKSMVSTLALKEKQAAEGEKSVAAQMHRLVKEREIKQMAAREAEAFGQKENARVARAAIESLTKQIGKYQKQLLALSEKTRRVEADAKVARETLERSQSMAKNAEDKARALILAAAKNRKVMAEKIDKIRKLKASGKSDLQTLRQHLHKLETKIMSSSPASYHGPDITEDDLTDAEAHARAKSQLEGMLQAMNTMIMAKSTAEVPLQQVPVVPAQPNRINIVIGCGKKCGKNKAKSEPKAEPKAEGKDTSKSVVETEVKKAVKTVMKEKAEEDADRLERRRLELEHDQRVQEQAAEEVKVALEAKRDADDKIMLLKSRLSMQRQTTKGVKTELNHVKAISAVDKQKAEEQMHKLAGLSEV